MRSEVLILLLSAIAGVIGTGIGGVLGAYVKDKSPSAVGDMLAFAAGIMLGVTAFEMLPEAVKIADVFSVKIYGKLLVVAMAFSGVGIVAVLNLVTERTSKNKRLESAKIKTSPCDNNLKRAGITTLVAIALHNIPEGMAIGASGAGSLLAGIVVAIVIALHNVPEGMAISAPLAGGGMKAGRAVLLAVSAGSATLVGAVIGVLVGGINALASGISVSFASGVMICVACFDLIPLSSKMKSSFASLAFFSGIATAMTFALLF